MHYANPILKGDFSDPDVVRVGNDYYMISSSFTYFPGIPLLHSTDLVHWTLVNHIAPHLPFSSYDAPRHKCGLWAPSIRHHDGMFYVYVCTPDEGLLAFTGADPLGEFRVRHVKDVSGWIDPCPFWDDDGQAYLLHAFAGSRAGIKNRLFLHRMSADGMAILDDGVEVYAGGDENPTTEGPKMYKIDGTYWILCPSGGVPQGWQLAMRSKSPYGPYEVRRVLDQKDTPVNGPHQGGLVDTPKGDWWFLHFQDRAAYGRVVHLQPVTWQDGFPVMGDQGAPVLCHEMPDTGAVSKARVQTSDDFAGMTLSQQWQWQAHENRAWYRLTGSSLRLYAASAPNLFHAGQYLSQLMQAFHSRWEVRLSARFDRKGDRAGIGILGYAYRYLCLEEGGLALYQGKAEERSRREAERVMEQCLMRIPYERDRATFRMEIKDGCATFSYIAPDGTEKTAGDPFPMAAGGWVGARPGIFCGNFEGNASGGWADFESVHIEDMNADGPA